MHFYRLAQWLRLPALVLFTIVLASCGSGSGESSVDAAVEDIAATEMRVVFRDDFGGPAVAARPGTASKLPPAPLPIGNWVVDTGYGSNGWGNDEWQRYDNSMDNLFTEDGSLVLRARCATAPVCGKRDGSITSAKITTKDRLNIKFGNIKARIKMPSGLGMWPAFWTLGSDIDDRPWPDAGELDIVEMHYFYSDNRTTHFATHWSAPDYAVGEAPVCFSGVASSISAGEVEHCASSDEPIPKTFDFPLTDDFHVYEMDWNENQIIGKIDGITYFTQAIDAATMEEFLKDHYLLLNVAVGGTLGGMFGPAMSAADWADPNQTDMLVDWVEVSERIPPSSATLIDESGRNLGYNRIINSAEFNGAFVESELDSSAVAPLVGSTVLELTYSTSVSPNGGVPAGFSGAIFDFNNIDLSSFTKIVFSIDTSQFPGFDDIGIEFEDSRGNKLLLRTSNYLPTAINGNWKTYGIPFSDFAGVDIDDIVMIGFFNPYDSADTLIAGTLFIDDIRFVSESCTAVGSVAFDSIDYNPAAPVGAVRVNDICAANSFVTVKVEAGTDAIVVGVKLDAAGNGETIFNLVSADSVCAADDSTSILKLTGSLLATYTRTYFDAAGTSQFNTATATAGINASAPASTLTGEQSYFYSTNPGQTLTFKPDVNFAYSIFGSESVLNGAFADSTFNPVFAVTSGTGYGGGIEVAQVALIGGGNFSGFTGFAAGKDSINFKVKNLPGDQITVEFGVLGGASQPRVINLVTNPGSSSIGDGWYQVSIPMTEFPAVNNYNFMAFTGGDGGTTPFTYLITDVYLQDAVGNVPAECANVVQPPVAGSGTGATGATGDPLSVSFDNSAVIYNFIGFGQPDTITAVGADPLDSTNLVAMTTKPLGAQVWAGVTVAPTPGITYPLSAVNNELTIRIYAPGAGLTVLMKLEDAANAANFVEAQTVTTVDTGWETLTFAFTNPPVFTYDKLSLFFGFGTAGDGSVYTWDTIEFVGGTPPPSGGELITNGDFEAGDLSGWTQGGSGGTFTADNTQNSGSTWSGHVVAGVGNNPFITQANLAVGTVMPGDTIDISFDLCGSAASGGVIFPALLSEFGVGAGGNRQTLETIAVPPGNWTRYNYSVPAGGNVDGGITLQLDVVCGGAAGCSADVYFDNVSVSIGGGPAPGSASGLSCAGGPGPVTEPTVAAPTPTLAPLDVIAVFSDAYPVVLGPGPVDYNPGWGQATVATQVDVAGNNTLKYAGLNYQGTDFGGAQDLATAGMTNLHVDFWTADSTALNVYLIGGGVEFPIALTPNLGNWVSVDIPVANFIGVDLSQVIQFKFDGNGTIFIDNLYFSCAGCGGGNAFPTAPVVAAPTPTLAPADVIAVFSDDYPVVLGPGPVDYNPNWGQATVTTQVDVAGNNTLKYAGLNYQGTDFGGAQDLATAGMTNLHVDFWTVDSTALNVYLIGGGAEFPVALTPSPGNWVSVDIPLAEFIGVDLSQVIQFKFDGNGTIFIDNLYFAATGGVASGELTTNGDFETGDFTGTVQFVNGGTQSISTVNPSAGIYSANLNVVTAQADTVLKFANLAPGGFTPGQTIFISFDMRGSLAPGGVGFAEFFSELSGGGTSSAEILFGGGPIFPNANPDTWTNFNTTAVTGSDSSGGVTLQLKGASGGGNLVDLYFDNVCVSTLACP